MLLTKILAQLPFTDPPDNRSAEKNTQRNRDPKNRCHARIDCTCAKVKGEHFSKIYDSGFQGIRLEENPTAHHNQHSIEMGKNRRHLPKESLDMPVSLQQEE